MAHWTRADGFAGQETAQILCQRQGAGIALAWLLFQPFDTDGRQVAGQFRLQPARRHRVERLDLEQGLQRRLRAKRGPAREQFIEDCAQRIDVGGGADCLGLAPGLLRGHVAGRANDSAGLRLNCSPAAQQLGQAKVGDLGLVRGEW